MKKIISVAFLVLSIASCAFAAEMTKFSKNFIKNFKDCDKYEETVTSQYEGESFTTHRKINGWKSGFCRYEEVITSPTSQYKLSCNFSHIQVEELYNAMKSRSKEVITHELELFGEQTDPKTGKKKYTVMGSETIKGNKAYVAWAKYQNNPYFCAPQKLK